MPSSSIPGLTAAAEISPRRLLMQSFDLGLDGGTATATSREEQLLERLRWEVGSIFLIADNELRRLGKFSMGSGNAVRPPALCAIDVTG